jgi:hypothetical protein
MVEPTIINPEHLEESKEAALLSVDSNGDLILHADNVTIVEESC